MQGLHKFLLLHVLTCLRQNGHGSQNIDGEIVPEDSMLYMVSVQNSKGHVCGGFLVSEKFVVTAAHCDEEKPTVVLLGTHNLKEVNKYVYIENKYKPGNGDDIMLLKLSRKAELGNRVQTIQLPAPETNVKENQQCLVAGWGQPETGVPVDELRMVDVSVVSPQDCKEKCNSLPANVICAGELGTKKGFGQGDSGGPLVCNGIAVGVMSFTGKCAYPGAPNVYTDISKHLHWIHNIIKHP